MEFCHISPVPHLEDFCQNRPAHLTLAHLIERDDRYVDFYLSERDKNPNMLNIMDNSAYEVVKHFANGGKFYEVDQLIDYAKKIKADYIVMTDFPEEPGQETISAAQKQMFKIKAAGFGTFFVPQSEIRQYSPHELISYKGASLDPLEDLDKGFLWALDEPNIDYIAFSILSIPNAYGVEQHNVLQRYLCRFHYLQRLDAICRDVYGMPLKEVKCKKNKSFHFLGMVDGPNEISLIKSLESTNVVDTWDSSSAIWAGLNGIMYDDSPTGLINGKVQLGVDFNYYTPYHHSKVVYNMRYIDALARA